MSSHVLQTLFQRKNSEQGSFNRVTICGEHVFISEFIKGRLFFVTLSPKASPKESPNYHFFNIDNELVYLNYAADFGPLNLSNIAKYFEILKSKLSKIPNNKLIIHYTSSDANKRANAAFLIAAFATVFLHKTPKEAYQLLLVGTNPKPFKPFQDAAASNSCHLIRILDCLEGLDKAKKLGFVRFDDFNFCQYEFYSYIRHGDMNWIVPKKLIAFSGPVSGGNTPYRPPEHYVRYFKDNGVTTVIRLNKRAYDSRCFTACGLDHKELYFLDGSCPPKHILEKFLEIAETTPGVIAIHCKAGLGRTGSLIGAYLIKHYQMSAKEAIAWMRIVRPGSVIGNQQTWLEDHEDLLWAEGEQYRIIHHGDPQKLPFHRVGINSFERDSTQKKHPPEHRIRVASSTKPRNDPPPAGPPRANNSPRAKASPLHSMVEDLRAGPSFQDKGVSCQSQPSVKSLFYSPTQKGRRHAYVPGKIAGSIPNVVNGKCCEVAEKKENANFDTRKDTQGDRLRRAKVSREKWAGSQGGLDRRYADRSPP